MPCFSVEFLGCKVSQVDAQEIRERLIADGHTEAQGKTDVAVISTCCVTSEAVAKSRKAARRAARRAAFRDFATASFVTQHVLITAMSVFPSASTWP